eukprot:gene26101-11815_t
MSRVISFEYLNRQLVWQELSEFLLFMLPLISIAKLRRLLATFLPSLPNPALLLSSMAGGQPTPTAPTAPTSSCQDDSSPGGSTDSSEVPSKGEAKQAAAQQLLDSSCPLCGIQNILIPYIAHPCKHMYCYYCLRSSCEADVAFSCVLDGVRVASMRSSAAVHSGAVPYTYRAVPYTAELWQYTVAGRQAGRQAGSSASGKVDSKSVKGLCASLRFVSE